jgi:hypothetical protein
VSRVMIMSFILIIYRVKLYQEKPPPWGQDDAKKVCAEAKSSVPTSSGAQREMRMYPPKDQTYETNRPNAQVAMQ